MSQEFSTTWIAKSKMPQNRTMVFQIANKLLAMGKSAFIGHDHHSGTPWGLFFFSFQAGYHLRFCNIFLQNILKFFHCRRGFSCLEQSIFSPSICLNASSLSCCLSSPNLVLFPSLLRCVGNRKKKSEGK